jgi:hypothetical protein
VFLRIANSNYLHIIAQQAFLYVAVPAQANANIAKANLIHIAAKYY